MAICCWQCVEAYVNVRGLKRAIDAHNAEHSDDLVHDLEAT